MSIPNDEQVEAAFGDLAEAAAVMANPTEVAVLRTRVRRRRAARAGVAGIAALAVLSTSGWLIQQAVGQENEPRPADRTTAVEETVEESASPPTAESTTEADEETPVSAPLPHFADLVGTTMDLPSFMPGNELVDQACAVDGVELADGSDDGDGDTGVVYLRGVVQAPMTEGGPERAVAFLSCEFAEATAFQAVLLAEDGSGGWEVAEQLIHSKPNADSPYDIAADPDYGVLIGVAESFACCATDPDELDYWVERARLDGDGEPVLERIEEGDLSASAITDLSITVEVTPTGGEREWTVTLTVRNEGDRTSVPFDLSGCGEDIDFDREILSCSGGVEGHSESGPALEPGETHTVEWTATVPPRSEWSEDTVFMDGPTFWAHVSPNDWDADVLVRDTLLANSRDDHKFTE